MAVYRFNPAYRASFTLGVSFMVIFFKKMSIMTFIGLLVLMDSQGAIAKEFRKDMDINGINSSVIITTDTIDIENYDEIKSVQLVFGSQIVTLTSSELEKLSRVCCVLSGFGNLNEQKNGQNIDFDGDHINDFVVGMVFSTMGSSASAMYFIVSSSTRKAWLYLQSSGGNGYWAGITAPLPEIKEPFIIYEELDYMPRFPGIEDVVMVHAEEMGFIFTRVWDGDGFSYRPVTEFYKALLPQVGQAIKEGDNKDIQRLYKRIEVDFKKAANGQEISSETMQSSLWKLIKAFDTEPER